MDCYKHYSSNITTWFLPMHRYKEKLSIVAGQFLNNIDVKNAIVENTINDIFNNFTNKETVDFTRIWYKRLEAIKDSDLIEILTEEDNLADPLLKEQICLYSLVKTNCLLYDFMLTVVSPVCEDNQHHNAWGYMIDEDTLRFCIQCGNEMRWRETTILKARREIKKALLEVHWLYTDRGQVYLRDFSASRVLIEGIKRNHDDDLLPAFNYFE